MQLFNTFRSADPQSAQGRNIRALGLPVGAAETQARDPVALLELANRLASDPKTSRLFNLAVTTDTAQAAALGATPETIASIRASRAAGDKAEFDVNGPLQQSVGRTTTGLSGAAITREREADAILDQLGGSVQPLVTGSVGVTARALERANEATGGKDFDSRNDAFILQFAKSVAIELGLLVKQGVSESLGFGEPTKVEIDARAVSNTTGGGVGDQTVTE
jgi:hypothetical protein